MQGLFIFSAPRKTLKLFFLFNQRLSIRSFGRRGLYENGSRLYVKVSRYYENVSRLHEKVPRLFEKVSRLYEKFSRYYEKVSRLYTRRVFITIRKFLIFYH